MQVRDRLVPANLQAAAHCVNVIQLVETAHAEDREIVGGNICRTSRLNVSESCGFLRLMYTQTKYVVITDFQYWGNMPWKDCRAEGHFRRDPLSRFNVWFDDEFAAQSYPGTQMDEIHIETQGSLWLWSGQPDDSLEPSSGAGKLLLNDLILDFSLAIEFRRICATAERRAYYADDHLAVQKIEEEAIAQISTLAVSSAELPSISRQLAAMIMDAQRAGRRRVCVGCSLISFDTTDLDGLAALAWVP